MSAVLGSSAGSVAAAAAATPREPLSPQHRLVADVSELRIAGSSYLVDATTGYVYDMVQPGAHACAGNRSNIILTAY